MQQTKTEQRMQKISALQAMAANYGKTIDPALLKLWVTLLEPYSVEAVNNAVLQVIQNYGFKTLPPFAELKKYLDGNETEAQHIATKAEAEWGLLLENIRLYGWNNEPDMHQTTDLVVRSMGGWQAVCAWPEAYLGLKHKEFVERWQLYDGQADLMQGGAAALEEAREARLTLATGKPVQKPVAALSQGAAPVTNKPAQPRQLPRGFLRRVDDACRPEEATEQGRAKAAPAYVPRYKGKQDPLASLSPEERHALARAVGESV